MSEEAKPEITSEEQPAAAEQPPATEEQPKVIKTCTVYMYMYVYHNSDQASKI